MFGFTDTAFDDANAVCVVANAVSDDAVDAAVDRNCGQGRSCHPGRTGVQRPGVSSGRSECVRRDRDLLEVRLRGPSVPSVLVHTSKASEPSERMSENRSHVIAFDTGACHPADPAHCRSGMSLLHHWACVL